MQLGRPSSASASKTPSEELSVGRGDAFAQEEARERKKDAAVDGEYVEAGRRVRRGKSAQRTSATD